MGHSELDQKKEAPEDMYITRNLTLHKCGASYPIYVRLIVLCATLVAEVYRVGGLEGRIETEWGTHGQSGTRNSRAGCNHENVQEPTLIFHCFQGSSSPGEAP